jgi:predicted GNAT family acetyltransferase
MLLLQAPVLAGELAQACVASSERSVTGLAGPAEHVRKARVALGLEEASAAVEGDEWLCTIDLAAVVVPAALTDGDLSVRAPSPEERDLLCEWRMAYDIELLGATDSIESRQRSAAFLDAQIAAGNAWVAVAGGRPVSLSAFNAALPDVVQLGGIYTPMEHRGRGFARVAVAASLLAARDRGVSRAVLFTNNPSALRTYEAVGFQRTGDYSLVLLR